MRKIVAGLFSSLDGVVESPEKWHFTYFNDEMGEAVQSSMAASDAMLFGRVTYQEFASYWPNANADDPFAAMLNNVPKYVVSTTLDKAEWNHSTLLNGDFVDDITKLKQQPGGNIGMTGSGTLVESLLQHDLLDELWLFVHPVVVSNGKRLFKNGGDLKPLKLVKSTTFSTGVLWLIYQPATAE